MWSVGCVICELYTGKHSSDTKRGIVDVLVAGEVWFHCSDRSSLYHSMLDVLGPMPQAMLSAGKYSPISSGKSTGGRIALEQISLIYSHIERDQMNFPLLRGTQLYPLD